VRGSRNEKVVSSVDASSVTIFILHQSPFRFAATAALRCYGGNGFLPRRAPTRGTPTYFHSSSATGFPLAPIRESAIFRGRFRHASDDGISSFSLSLSSSFSRPRQSSKHDDPSTFRSSILAWPASVYTRLSSSMLSQLAGILLLEDSAFRGMPSSHQMI